ncbi:MAG: Rho termination factor N-terminal domain-containing protein, partial [Treponema sp.]|nr:Rho termination factor N-terminal domain-containing protein [Treponema sp.]
MAVARRSTKVKSAELPLEEEVTEGRRKRIPAEPVRDEDFSSPGNEPEEGQADPGEDNWGGDDTQEDRPGGRVVVRARTRRVVSPREPRDREPREREPRERDSRERDNREPRSRQGSGEGYDNGNSYADYSRLPEGARPAAKPPAEGNFAAPPPKARPPVSQEAMALPKSLPPMPDIYGKPEPRGDQDNGKPRLCINELIRLNMMDLRDLAACYNISHEDMVNMKKQEIIFSLLKAHTERGGVIYAYGSLEILPDSYGFLRSPQNSYLPGPDDIYISPSQIRLFALKTGDTVYGQIRSPKEQERFFAMLRVETVNYDDPTVAQNRIPFDNLTPLYPNRKLNLET